MIDCSWQLIGAFPKCQQSLSKSEEVFGNKLVLLDLVWLTKPHRHQWHPEGSRLRYNTYKTGPTKLGLFIDKKPALGSVAS